jgi:hypothetical protein
MSVRKYFSSYLLAFLLHHHHLTLISGDVRVVDEKAESFVCLHCARKNSLSFYVPANVYSKYFNFICGVIPRRAKKNCVHYVIVACGMRVSYFSFFLRMFTPMTVLNRSKICDHESKCWK